MMDIINNTSNVKMQRKVDLNKHRDDKLSEEDLAKTNFHTFLNASSAIKCARHDMNADGVSSRSLSNEPTPKQQKNAKASIWPGLSALSFNRNDSGVRNAAIFAAHNKRETKERSIPKLKANKGIATTSIYGHEAFYSQSGFGGNDFDLNDIDSDNDIGDIAPGLEYYQEQNSININKLASSEIEASNCDEILMSFDRFKKYDHENKQSIKSAATRKTIPRPRYGTKVGINGIRYKSLKSVRTNKVKKNTHLVTLEMKTVASASVDSTDCIIGNESIDDLVMEDAINNIEQNIKDNDSKENKKESNVNIDININESNTAIHNSNENST